jgi:hypothetical protein
VEASKMNTSHDHDDPDPAAPDLDHLALALRCETCHADPRDWCTTRTGRHATHLHAARVLVVQAVYLLGYEHGRTGTGAR